MLAHWSCGPAGSGHLEAAPGFGCRRGCGDRSCCGQDGASLSLVLVALSPCLHPFAARWGEELGPQGHLWVSGSSTSLWKARRTDTRLGEHHGDTRSTWGHTGARVLGASHGAEAGSALQPTAAGRLSTACWPAAPPSVSTALSPRVWHRRPAGQEAGSGPTLGTRWNAVAEYQFPARARGLSAASSSRTSAPGGPVPSTPPTPHTGAPGMGVLPIANGSSQCHLRGLNRLPACLLFPGTWWD